MLQAIRAFERAVHHHQSHSYSEVTAPYQRECLQHLQRIARAVLGVGDDHIETSSTGVLTLCGLALDPLAATMDKQSGNVVTWSGFSVVHGGWVCKQSIIPDIIVGRTW